MRYAEDTTIKLHTDSSGRIWSAIGAKAPQCSSTVLSDLANHEMWNSSAVVRVVGTEENAPLLVWLYARRELLHITRLDVGGPQVCETKSELHDPEVTLYRMRQCLLPAAAGGWHRFNATDFCTYQLTVASAGRDHAKMLLLLEQHPLWTPLSFVPDLCKETVAEIIGMVIDPRWYVTVKRPDRLSRFRRFLGLEDVNSNSGRTPAERMARMARKSRAALLLRCWQAATPSPIEMEMPRNFLWRVYRDAGGGERGCTRATQYFAYFLFHVWRNAVSPTADGLFDPSAIFKSPAEVAAFALHLRTSSKPV